MTGKVLVFTIIALGILILDPKTVIASDESDDHVAREFALESASRNRELQLELDGLRMRLDSARQQTEQMRMLATEAETRLVEATEENKLLEQRLSQELNESKQSKCFGLPLY